MLYYIRLYYITLQYITLHYINYIILLYIILYYTILTILYCILSGSHRLLPGSSGLQAPEEPQDRRGRRWLPAFRGFTELGD